jgi:hypothetical protein
VGYTENVILYREHLTDDGSVSGAEAVPEQLETHSWNGDTHSKIHVGDQNWGSADTSASIEIDYHPSAATLQNGANPNFATGIEDNLALYGFDSTVTVDEMRHNVPKTPTGDLSSYRIASLSRGSHNTGADNYLLISRGLTKSYGETGVTLKNMVINYSVAEGAADNTVTGQAAEASFGNSPYNHEENFVAAKVAMHEFGHVKGIGEADDGALGPYDETYTDDTDDDTIEEIDGTIQQTIMGRAFDQRLMTEPMNGSYFAYSIEELLTIDNGFI